MAHTIYKTVEDFKEFYIDENGIEIADSIDLSDCDYLLDEVNVNEEWENLISEEVNRVVAENELPPVRI